MEYFIGFAIALLLVTSMASSDKHAEQEVDGWWCFVCGRVHTRVEVDEEVDEEDADAI